MEKKIKVALYEDNPALRTSLAKLIALSPDMEVCGSYPNPVDILDQTKKNLPDVILMDLDMPGMSGIEATRLLHPVFPDIKIVIQTVFEDDDKVFDSICAGAVGYILKNIHPSEITQIIREASEGGAPMTPVIAQKVLQQFRKQVPVPATKNAEFGLSEREREILNHLTQGLSYKMISAACHVSIDTVRFHIKKIYEKLHVHSMTEAVSKALKDGLV